MKKTSHSRASKASWVNARIGEALRTWVSNGGQLRPLFLSLGIRMVDANAKLDDEQLASLCAFYNDGIQQILAPEPGPTYHGFERAVTAFEQGPLREMLRTTMPDHAEIALKTCEDFRAQILQLKFYQHLQAQAEKKPGSDTRER